MPSNTNASDELTRTLFHLSHEILASQDLQATLDAILQAIAEHTPFRRGALTLYDRVIPPVSVDEVGAMRMAFVGFSEADIEAIRADAMTPEERRKIFQERFRVGRSYYIPHELDPWCADTARAAEDEPISRDEWHPEDMLFIPLWLGDGELIGLISVDDPDDERAPTAERLEPMETFANLAALAITKARDIEALRASQRRLRGVYALSAELAGVDDLKTLVERAMAVIVGGFEYDYGALLLVEREALVLRGVHTTLPADEIALDRGTTIPLGEGVTGWVAERQKTAWIRDAGADPRFIAAHPDLRSELAVPIASGGTTLGVLNIESTAVDAFGELDRELLEALADQLAVAIESVRRRQELGEMATRDPLTGAYNRHFFAELMDRERARSERTGRPISLIMLDLDGFHLVNERHGHLTGDAVLREVARVLMANVREMDAVIRYGGDEFLVVMPETNAEAATAACRRVEARLHELDVGLEEPLRASFGTSTWYPAEDRSLDEVIEEADRWMYRRKARIRPD